VSRGGGDNHHLDDDDPHDPDDPDDRADASHACPLGTASHTGGRSADIYGLIATTNTFLDAVSGEV
jgi:hypothetical protein